MKRDFQKMNNYEKKKKTTTKIRSPLLDLGSNGREGDISAHSSSINGGHNSCFHFLVSSNDSSSSASSSLSGTGKRKIPKPSSPASNGKQRWKSTKENILPIPISLKPASKNSIKPLVFPNPCSHRKNARSGSGNVAANLKRTGHRNGSGVQPIQVFDLGNVSSSENFTPVGKRKTADYTNFEDSIYNNNVGKDSDVKSSNNVVKTPPIKASVSPEIQCNVFSATSDSAAAITPCYSAGHVLSGISDKRKCRPIGVLTVQHLPDASLDCEKANKKSCIIGILNEQKADCVVPLPAEASMHWLLSSRDENGNVQKSCSAHQFRGAELPYSPSLCCKVDSDVSGSEERKCSCNFMKSPVSGSSVSSGNVIQTPNSDSSSDSHITFSC